jgi:hypothetical protein
LGHGNRGRESRGAIIFTKAQVGSADFEGDLRSHQRGTAPRPHQSRRLTDGGDA